MENIDLFEHYTLQPPALAAICDKYSLLLTEGETYQICAEFLEDVETIGYTFDYYLDAEPHNLRLKEKGQNMKLSNEQAELLGQAITELLDLYVKENGRVDTDGGDKTMIGLGRTLERNYTDALKC